jgi:hypothetical protein
MISSSLERFKWKKDNLANCRCPFCGDSSSNKRKARGYFFVKGNDMYYRCHNCGHGTTMYRFLESMSPILCKEYSLERWKNGENGHSNYKKPEIIIEKPIFRKSTAVNLPSIHDLDDSHHCKIYVKNRKIPTEYWSDLYYAEDFGEFARNVKPDLDIGDEERLIIPVRNSDGNILGFQGRSLNKKNPIKYITLKYNENEVLCYGCNKIDSKKPVFIVEGPIDSMFIKNCIAILGMNNVDSVNYDNAIFVLDNEPRSLNVIQQMIDLIDSNRRVCIWPEKVKQKDINDMILSGLSSMQIQEMILNNSYKGPEAKMRVIKWKKTT